MRTYPNLISAKLVAQIRQNQKTDKNDALAIAQASQLVDVNFINGKDFDQQSKRCDQIVRENIFEPEVAPLIGLVHKEALISIIFDFFVDREEST